MNVMRLQAALIILCGVATTFLFRYFLENVLMIPNQLTRLIVSSVYLIGLILFAKRYITKGYIFENLTICSDVLFLPFFSFYLMGMVFSMYFM